jgi:hypothetical protein
MTQRIRNLLIFVGAVVGTGLLFIGVIALLDGDASGWRAVIGAVFAFALTITAGLRRTNKRKPDV